MSRIVLIGGSSCVGKTTAARALADEDGYRHVEVDRAWADHPGRAFAKDRSVWQLPTERLVDKLVEKARFLQPRIVRWVNEQTDERIVLEGEGIEPPIMREIDPAHDVRVVFIIETDAARLRTTLEGRSRSFRTLSEHEQLAVAALNARYNRRLLELATAPEQDCLSSQPWESLATRLRAAIHSNTPGKKRRQSSVATCASSFAPSAS